MKRFGYTLSLLCLLFAAIFMSQLEADNRLKWVEVTKTALSTQIMFDFEKPVQCSPEVIKEESKLSLSFPGMNFETFNPETITPHLHNLKKNGVLKTFDLYEQADSDSGIDLTLEFQPYRKKSAQGERTKNKFLIKWSVLEFPHRLILDIYPKENLDRLTTKDAVLLHAENDSVVCDIASPSTTQARHTARIVIDPGHGGSDTGAQGFSGLIEKHVTLDIAQRVRTMLKQQGFNALMTRSNDKDVSLSDRAQLAQQLKADLFVSIHVNSSGNKDNPAWGIETFYCDGQPLLPHSPTSATYCFNFNHDSGLVNHLQQQMKRTIVQSKTLATEIQNSILGSLDSANIATNNRGVKQEKFRVLLQTSIPSALVEVGFLTNRQEARRLSQKPYRNIIARGICDGIKNFFQTTP